ncbi:thiamine diphosphokinase [Polaribacter marinivivus]|uniref:Thiamine diphosphokinase n=1 Tax=Polaribacter marinivivus TaxID=1524260 RepID=A0ABV8RAB7_9FLAO
MKNKKVFLLLNGEKPKEVPNFSVYDLICATDGAYQYLEKYKIVPDFVSGDLDSLEAIPKEIEVIKTTNQDFTDFDKILQILFDKGFTKIDVYGASGQEQDHFLGNLDTAIRWKKKLSLTFFDNNGTYFLAKKKIVLSNCKGKIISLIPFPKASKVETFGLKYSLKKETLKFGKRIGTRNLAIDKKVKINFKKGNMFVFINN